MTKFNSRLQRQLGFYKDIKSFSILQTEVDGHTKYLQGIDLPIMVNSIFENDNFTTSEVSEMHIEMVNGNQTLIITPEILSLPD